MASMASLNGNSRNEDTAAMGADGGLAQDRQANNEEIRGGFVLRSKSDQAPHRRRSLVERTGMKTFVQGLKLKKQRSTGDINHKGVTSIRSTGSTTSWMSSESGYAGGGSASVMSEGSNQSFAMEDEQLDPSVTETYMGEWKNDKRSGFGISERSDGLKYEGEWFNNRKYGYGITTNHDFVEEGKYKNNVLVTSLTKRHLFLMRSAKFRERIDSAVNAAQRASKIALQKADIAISRTATARGKAEQADIAAMHAVEDAQTARVTAKQYGGDVPDRDPLPASSADPAKKDYLTPNAFNQPPSRQRSRTPDMARSSQQAKQQQQQLGNSLNVKVPEGPSSRRASPSPAIAQQTAQQQQNVGPPPPRTSTLSNQVPGARPNQQQQFQPKFSNNSMMGNIPTPVSSNALQEASAAIGPSSPQRQQMLQMQQMQQQKQQNSLQMQLQQLQQRQLQMTTAPPSQGCDIVSGNPYRDELDSTSPFGGGVFRQPPRLPQPQQQQQQARGRATTRSNNPGPAMVPTSDAAGGYNFNRIMDDHFEHYKRPASRERSVDHTHFPSVLPEAIVGSNASKRSSYVGGGSRAPSRNRTPVPVGTQQGLSSTTTLGSTGALDQDRRLMGMDPATRDHSKSNGGPPGLLAALAIGGNFGTVGDGAGSPPGTLRYRRPSQEIAHVGAVPKRTESMYFKPLLDEESMAKNSKDHSIGVMKRKKSLPEVQDLVVVTKTQGSTQMTREEIGVLSAARREALRQQLDEIERYKKNPLLYLVNPSVRDWIYRQRLLLFIIALNMSLAVVFYKLLS